MKTKSQTGKSKKQRAEQGKYLSALAHGPARGKFTIKTQWKNLGCNYEDSVKYLNPEIYYDTMYPKEKGEKMKDWIVDIIAFTVILVGILLLVLAFYGACLSLM